MAGWGKCTHILPVWAGLVNDAGIISGRGKGVPPLLFPRIFLRGVLMNQWAGVVLAAGRGARMKSRLPKVLHRVCGKEMVRYPVNLLRQLGAAPIVVVASPSNVEALKQLLGDDVEYVVQPAVTGTGDAVTLTSDLLGNSADNLLVLGADSPLVQTDTVKALMTAHIDSSSHMSLLTGQAQESGDLGQVVRDESGQVTGIVEAADGSAAVDGPVEVNGGVYCFSTPWLRENLPRIQPSQSGELYLTSLVSIGVGDGSQISAFPTSDTAQLQGVNNRVQLATVESALRQRINQQWMLDGVTILDPESVFIDAEVTLGRDSIILPNTMLLGQTVVGDECEIGPGSMVRDSSVGNRCRVTSSVLEGATMEDGADIGPFSHLRPGAYLESGVHVGNFAEVKESRLATGVLMGHFGYVGDASIGANVNLGAGMVTCNFDGQEKHRTNIGAGAFVGCDTMLVAPVNVGEDAITGAGSVITEDVPPGRLAVGVPARIVTKTSDSG